MDNKAIIDIIERSYVKGLDDGKGQNDITPFSIVSRVIANEIYNKFSNKFRSSDSICECTGRLDMSIVNDVTYCNQCRNRFFPLKEDQK